GDAAGVQTWQAEVERLQTAYQQALEADPGRQLPSLEPAVDAVKDVLSQDLVELARERVPGFARFMDTLDREAREAFEALLSSERGQFLMEQLAKLDAPRIWSTEQVGEDIYLVATGQKGWHNFGGHPFTLMILLGMEADPGLRERVIATYERG